MEDPQSRRHRTHPTTDRTDPANTSSPRKLVRSSRLTSPVDTVFLRLWVPSINLVGVAVQEMHHLARVNELLGQLRAPPNLVRQDFPYEHDIYPFELSLEPLSRRRPGMARPSRRGWPGC